MFLAFNNEIEWNGKYIIDIDELLNLPFPEIIKENKEDPLVCNDLIKIETTLSTNVLNTPSIQQLEKREYKGLV